MRSTNKLTDAMRNDIYLMTLRKCPREKIAELLGISCSSVRAVLITYKLAHSKDIDGLCKAVLQKNRSIEEARWACEMNGYSLPKEVEDAWNSRTVKGRSEEACISENEDSCENADELMEALETINANLLCCFAEVSSMMKKLLVSLGVNENV